LFIYATYSYHKAPCYLADIVTPTASVSSHGRLRSASSSRCEQPRIRLKFSPRCYSTAITATLSNTDTFKLQLKTGLFERASF